MSISIPTQNREKILYTAGVRCVAGVDEAGRGALAGPLVAAAVILPITPRIKDIQDSKQLRPNARLNAYKKIISIAESWSVSIQSAQTIDERGVQYANVFAMHDAVRTLHKKPEHIFSDYLQVELGIPNTALPHGDAEVYSIAAASIIAKVTRDVMMSILAKHYPLYGFDGHKGYGTKQHFATLRQYGPSKIHRRLFLRKFFAEEKMVLEEKSRAVIY